MLQAKTQNIKLIPIRFSSSVILDEPIFVFGKRDPESSSYAYNTASSLNTMSSYLEPFTPLSLYPKYTLPYLTNKPPRLVTSSFDLSSKPARKMEDRCVSK